MKGRFSARWRHTAYPQIGERILDHRGVSQLRLPFGAWLFYVVFAWPTRRLVALTAVGVAPMAALYSVGISIASTTLSFALAAAFALAIVAGGLLRPRVHVVSEVPPRVEAGREFLVRYDVRNTGRRTVIDLAVETLRFPGIREVSLRSVPIPALAPGGHCVVEGGGKGLRRGRYRLQPLRCDTDFPSGLWCWGRTDWLERRLTVYPAYARLASLDLPDGARNRLDVQSARQLTRSALEFHGCREFRSGDSLRHVHARSSARLGAPVVKEFQAEGRGRTAIVVDTWRRSPSPEMGLGPDPVVEAALSLAAAISDFLARSDRVLELLVAGPGLYRFVSAGRMGFLEDVLDILSAVEAGTRDSLPDLIPTLVGEIRAIESVCLILGRWDRTRADLVRELEAQGVGVKTIVLTRRIRRGANDLPPELLQVDCRAVLRGEVVSL